MNPQERTLALIDLYRRAVDRAVKRLYAAFCEDDLLRAVNLRKIPREGTLDDGTTYRFHGVGCEVDDRNVVVDFDFGPDRRHDGFDAWRLRAFAEQFSEWTEYHDIRIVEERMKELERDGLIRNPHWDPSPHLYYFVAG
jgi:hypothetical protein